MFENLWFWNGTLPLSYVLWKQKKDAMDGYKDSAFVSHFVIVTKRISNAAIAKEKQKQKRTVDDGRLLTLCRIS